MSFFSALFGKKRSIEPLSEIELPVPELGEEAMALVADLQSEDSEVRKEAVRKLPFIKDPGATYYLVKAVSDEEPAVRKQALYSLSNVKQSEIENCLLAIRHPDNDVRKSVVQALGKMKDERVIKLLLDALNDSSVQVRTEAPLAVASAAGQLRMSGNRQVGPMVTERLIAVLARNDPPLKHAVLETLLIISGQSYGEDAARWRQWAKRNFA